MSSANLVSITYVPETTYGVPDTPLSGVTAETARFTSESLSGTPDTQVSTNIRTDRMLSGQVVTGLTVEGDLNIELAAGQFYWDMFEGAMMSTWQAAQTLAGAEVTLTTIDAQSATLTIAAGDFSSIGAIAGTTLQLIPATGSPVGVVVTSVTSATELVVATSVNQPAITAETMDVSHPEYLDIGAIQNSYTFSKAYEDCLHELTTDEHSQKYSGTLVGGFNVSASYGEIVSGTYNLNSNGWELENPSMQQNIVSAGGTINPATTTQSLNSSVDIPLITSGAFESTDFCTESLTITLDNGLNPNNCIGRAAPSGYTLGTANITVDVSAYLSDTAYDAWMDKKLDQVPVAISFEMANVDGGYSFSMPSVQLSFPDPSSDGQDEQVMIEASGTASVGSNGESALRIYKLVGDQ